MFPSGPSAMLLGRAVGTTGNSTTVPVGQRAVDPWIATCAE